MKKTLSGLLAASLITSLIGVLPPASKTAAATSPEDTAVSVTELSKYENNDIIITYKKEANATKKKTLSICGLSAARQADTEVTQLTENSVVLKLDSNADLKTSIEILSQDSRVAYIQPNYIYRLCDTDIDSVYNNLAQNTDFSKQWGLYNDGTTSYTETVSSFWGRPKQITIQATSRMDISLPEAWSICAKPKRETIVAIVDTGVMYDHDDLKEHIWTNKDEIAGDGIDNDNNGHIDDVHGWNFFDERVYDSSNVITLPVEGNNTYYNKDSNIEDSHGTHGAGTIAASNNNTGIAGIASNANVKIMSVKALGGDEGYGTTESVIQGIQYAEENGAHICNLSLGGDEDDTALRSVMENSSMLFTIAAGNGDSFTGHAINTDKNPTYPASFDYDNIIAVANLQCNGTLHSSSNYGAKSVDLAAPGSYIYSTSTGDGTYNSISSIPASSNYEYMSGTSMAAPMVAGVAAMLYSCYDNLSLMEIKNIIMNSVTPLSSLSGKCVSQGTLNAYQAVQLAENGSISQTVTPVPTSSVLPTDFNGTLSPKPTATVTPAITKTPIVTSTPVVSKKPVVTSTPVVTKTPVVTSTPVVSKKPVLTSTPVSSKTPVLTSTPVIRTTPVVSTTPMETISPEPTHSGESWFPDFPWFPFDPATSSPTPANTISPTPDTVPTAPVAVTTPDIIPQHTPTAAPVKTMAPIYDFLSIEKVTVSGSNTRYIGKKYTITPTVSGGNGNYLYRYAVSKNGKNYVYKDYSSNSSITWTPTAPGDYQIKISVRDSNGYDDYYSMPIHITNMKITSLKANKTLKKGVTVKFTANVNTFVGTPTYKFTMRNTKGSYSYTKNSKKNIFYWKVPAKGTYKLTVQVTDSKKNTVKKIFTFKVK